MILRSRLVTGAAVVGVAVAALTLTTATPSSAADSGNFGEHVRTCARTMGFSGTHNPGLHQGAAGWDGMACMES